MTANSNLSYVLGEMGPFATGIPGFAPREIQQRMAAAIENAIASSQKLVVEAGTGTGKTFAYLVPAIRSGKRVIVSTGTKNLQDQLFQRDLPVVLNALQKKPKIALLKGRNNYLCLQRLNQYARHSTVRSPQLASELLTIEHWSHQTTTGDISELAKVPEDSLAWRWATSTVDNCLGTECPMAAECHLLRARRKALEADVVVINHHLFFADAMLRDVGFGELLPGAEVVIFDEAHQLPEIASHFFGESISSWQFNELSRDVIRQQIADAPDALDLKESAEQIALDAQNIRPALGQQEHKGIWQNICHKPVLQASLNILNESMQRLKQALEIHAARSKNLAQCFIRCHDLMAHWNLLTSPPSEEHVHWYETQQRNFRIHITPLGFAEAFRKLLAPKAAWIFTSATLTVNDTFDHFTKDLGLEQAQTQQFPSGFDYPRQSLLYIPKNMPSPEKENYLTAVIEAAIPVLTASQGRAFFLFTSHRALQIAAKLLAHRVPFPLLVQGEMPKNLLLQTFCQQKNAILLGTSSFWEGVDVRGDTLSCVIIDKLPFANPDDPVLRARVQTLRQRNQDPFKVYQLPHAVIALKQGVGRLIRDVSDRGVLMIADPRLLTKDYGAVFLKSLPPMPLTHDVSDVTHFFECYEKNLM